MLHFSSCIVLTCLYCFDFLFLYVRHGLSKNTFEELRPLPEKPEEPYYPYPHEYNNQDVQSPEESEELSFSTSSSSNTFINGFFNESVSSVGTGGNITTGRSSAYSWGHEDVSSCFNENYWFALYHTYRLYNYKYSQIYEFHLFGIIKYL